jgi:CO/xanthine dehydrogenase Mo-binding subunit
VVTGKDSGVLTGSVLQDMPVLAAVKRATSASRVAIVVADEEWQAAQAVKKIKVEYRLCPLSIPLTTR